MSTVAVCLSRSDRQHLYQSYWRPWDPNANWVRDIPDGCFVAKDFDFYTREMWDYEFQECFAFWLRNRLGAKKIACLVGIRTQESFNRWQNIYRSKPGPSAEWICPVREGIDNIYTLYDWHTTDIWTANGHFRQKYNRLYDLYYQAGVPLNSQRVASPFISQTIQSLHLYRVIEPEMWGKMLGRVNGINFAGLYGNSAAMEWRAISLPEGEAKFIAFCQEKIKNGTLKDYKYIQEFRNRDSRMYVSILMPFKSWYESNYGDKFVYEWIKNGNNESKTGFNFRKMLSLENDANGDGQATGDYPCIRYAEILLIYAEAHTQTTGYDAATEAALNQLRDRCGMPDVPSGLSKEEGLKLIQNERRIELAGEGFRGDDMTRYSDDYWKEHMNNVPIMTPDGDTELTMKWSSRMRLKPIPQTDIDLNPLLAGDQNPGY